MTVVGDLTDVDVASAQGRRPVHGPLLVLEAGAGDVEVQPVCPGAACRSAGSEPEPDLGVIAGDQYSAGFADGLSAQQARPELRHCLRVADVESHRGEAKGHAGRLTRALADRHWVFRCGHVPTGRGRMIGWVDRSGRTRWS